MQILLDVPVTVSKSSVPCSALAKENIDLQKTIWVEFFYSWSGEPFRKFACKL